MQQPCKGQDRCVGGHSAFSEHGSFFRVVANNETGRELSCRAGSRHLQATYRSASLDRSDEGALRCWDSERPRHNGRICLAQ